MSEEFEQSEISPEDARKDAIRDMMDKWADGNLTDAQDSFNSITIAWQAKSASHRR
jgi:hypothetical protein